MNEIDKAYLDTIAKQLKGNGGSGWGGEDSVAVIEAITDAAYLGDKPEGFGAIADKVKALVNPSAFRQALEKQGLVKESVKGTRGVTKSAVNLLSSLPKL